MPPLEVVVEEALVHLGDEILIAEERFIDASPSQYPHPSDGEKMAIGEASVLASLLCLLCLLACLRPLAIKAFGLGFSSSGEYKQGQPESDASQRTNVRQDATEQSWSDVGTIVSSGVQSLVLRVRAAFALLRQLLDDLSTTMGFDDSSGFRRHDYVKWRELGSEAEAGIAERGEREYDARAEARGSPRPLQHDFNSDAHVESRIAVPTRLEISAIRSSPPECVRSRTPTARNRKSAGATALPGTRSHDADGTKQDEEVGLLHKIPEQLQLEVGAGGSCASNDPLPPLKTARGSRGPLHTSAGAQPHAMGFPPKTPRCGGSDDSALVAPPAVEDLASESGVTSSNDDADMNATPRSIKSAASNADSRASGSSMGWVAKSLYALDPDASNSPSQASTPRSSEAPTESGWVAKKLYRAEAKMTPDRDASSLATTPRGSEAPSRARTPRSLDASSESRTPRGPSRLRTPRGLDPQNQARTPRKSTSPQVMPFPINRPPAAKRPPYYADRHDSESDVLRGRSVPHAHRMQISFQLTLSGVPDEHSEDPVMLPPPTEIRFVLSVKGMDVEMPPPACPPRTAGHPLFAWQVGQGYARPQQGKRNQRKLFLKCVHAPLSGKGVPSLIAACVLSPFAFFRQLFSSLSNSSSTDASGTVAGRPTFRPPRSLPVHGVTRSIAMSSTCVRIFAWHSKQFISMCAPRCSPCLGGPNTLPWLHARQVT